MLWEAITELLGRARVRVGDVASIVGLLVWLFLVRRPLLSIFHSIFAFARRPASLVALWWPSARTELRAARDLLPPGIHGSTVAFSELRDLPRRAGAVAPLAGGSRSQLCGSPS